MQVAYVAPLVIRQWLRGEVWPGVFGFVEWSVCLDRRRPQVGQCCPGLPARCRSRSMQNRQSSSLYCRVHFTSGG